MTTTTEIVIPDVQRARLTPTGATFDPTITFDEWAALGSRLGGHETALRWAVGDWMLYGTEHFGTRAIVVASATGLAEQTISNTLSVCKRIPIDRRRSELSFTHHEELASQTPQQQDRLLRLAVDESLSCAALRVIVREERENRALTVNSNEVERHTIALRLTGEVNGETLQTAGQMMAKGLVDWLVEQGFKGVTVEIHKAA